MGIVKQEMDKRAYVESIMQAEVLCTNYMSKGKAGNILHIIVNKSHEKQKQKCHLPCLSACPPENINL